MPETITLRATEARDLAVVDGLLARSYPALLAADYPPSVMVTAVPIIARARPELVCSGRYYLAEDTDGQPLGAGGWSAVKGRVGRADIRHVVTDHRHIRRGIGRALFAHIFEAAARENIGAFDCLATRTAVPFYQAMGFVEVGPTTIPLAPGISFPAIRMVRSQPSARPLSAGRGT